MELAAADSPEAIRDVSERLINAFPAGDATIELFKSNAPGGSPGRANDRILVRLYRVVRRWDSASALLNRLIESAANDKDRGGLWYEVGELHHVAGDWSKAREGYENSLQYDPRNWVTLNNLAFLLSNEMGKNEEALAHARHAVEIADNPATLNDLYNALDTLGWIYVGLQQYSKAVTELSRAVRLQPDEALTYFHLGEAFRRQQQFDQAREMLETGRRQALQSRDEALAARINVALEKNQRRNAIP
jgi:tetratricopeptide (TPR) repeat protein